MRLVYQVGDAVLISKRCGFTLALMLLASCGSGPPRQQTPPSATPASTTPASTTPANTAPANTAPVTAAPASAAADSAAAGSSSAGSSSASVDAVPSSALPTAGVYQIDSRRSELRLLIYRAGALANLGHNHVIDNHALSGSVTVGSSWAASGFALSVPAAGFVIDDAQSRLAAGDDFSGEISDDARSGTARNMLGSALLNAADYPQLRVRSVRLWQSEGTLSAALTVTVAGRDADLTLPFTFTTASDTTAGDELSVTAAFELRQTALQLVPFSLMLGALQVRDAMQVELRLLARRE